MARDLDGLRQANAERAALAGPRNAERAARILAQPGIAIPEHWRRAARARIADPEAPWSQIAETLGLSKDQATGYYRRLLAATEGLHQ